LKKTFCLFMILCLLLTAGCTTQPPLRDEAANPDHLYIGDDLPQEPDSPVTDPEPDQTGTPNTQTPEPQAPTPEPQAPTGHTHSWAGATCTAPKTCKTCGATEGKALDHNLLDATCTRAGRCLRCAMTLPALGHDYQQGICTRCGRQENAQSPITNTTLPAIPATGYGIYKNHGRSAVNRYGFFQLNQEQQVGYSRLYKAALNLEHSIYLGSGWDQDSLDLLFRMFISDHPELFYIDDNAYSTDLSKDGKGYAYLYLRYTDGEQYNPYNEAPSPKLRANINDQIVHFNDEVGRILSNVPSTLRQVEKEKLLYDYLQQYCTYDKALADQMNGQLDNVHSSWSAYGALINKRAACEGYSEAFQVLCFGIGLDTAVISGSTNGEPHQWCAVFLEDDQWYACDPTFDDPLYYDANGNLDPTVYKPSYQYFNITTAQMAKNHTATSICAPTCNGTKYSYSNYFKS